MQYALYFVYLGLVVCFSSYAGGICDLRSPVSFLDFSNFITFFSFGLCSFLVCSISGGLILFHLILC